MTTRATRTKSTPAAPLSEPVTVEAIVPDDSTPPDAPVVTHGSQEEGGGPPVETVTILGPSGQVWPGPEPIDFVDGRAEVPPALAEALVNDPAAPGRYTYA